MGLVQSKGSHSVADKNYNGALNLWENESSSPTEKKQALSLWLDNANRMNHAPSAYKAACILQNGFMAGNDCVISANPLSALKLFESAAEAGHVDGIFRLGHLLRFGAEGVERDIVRARELYEKAADAGHLNAMDRLGLLLEHGLEGFEKDVLRAKELYERAAAGGLLSAMDHLAVLLFFGAEDIERDIVRAKELYERAADGGHLNAMDNLALLLERSVEGVGRDIVRAKELYEKAADSGHLHAMNHLALLLHFGAEGVEIDTVRAKELYERAADGGHLDAMDNLAFLLQYGSDHVEKNTARAKELYEKAADGGNKSAIYHLGFLLQFGGDGVERDYVRAKELYERAVSDGDLRGMDQLGLLLQYGADGVDKNTMRAKELFEKAADGGHLGAMKHLALLLEHGSQGVERDTMRAEELYEKAKDDSDLSMMSYFGLLLQHGLEGMEKDPVQAKVLLERAVAGGDLSAMDRLGVLLLSGADGIEEDTVRAKELYEKAADGGDLGGMKHLGLLLQYGAEGIESDVVRAKELYEKAADCGDLEAMNLLGLLLEDGTEGVEKDTLRAEKLYEKSADGGNLHGIYYLKRILERRKERSMNITPLSEKTEDIEHENSTRTLDVIPNTEDLVATTDVKRVAELRKAAREHPSTGGLLFRAHSFSVGDERTPKSISGASQCFEEAIELARLPDERASASTEYARFLLEQNDQAPHQDEEEANDRKQKAIELLENAVKLFPMHEAVSELISIYNYSQAREFRNHRRAAELKRLAIYREYSFKDGVVPYLEAEDKADKRLIAVMHEAVVKPRSCLLMTLGSPGRGKTATLNSLRGLPFVNNLASTELAELSQFVIEPGLHRLDDGMLKDLDFRENSFRAMASRLNKRDFQECERSMEAENSVIDDIVQHCAEKHRDVLEKVRAAASRFEIEGKLSQFVRCWDMGGQSEYEMAHSLFIGRADILVFVVNLKRVCNDKTREDEVKNLCYWMQLAHMTVRDPSEVRVIVVGTHKDEVDCEHDALDLLSTTTRLFVSECVDQSWVRKEDKKRGCAFVAIENSATTEDSNASGLEGLSKELTRCMKEVLEHKVEIPLRWLALVDKMRRVQGVKKVLWTKREVEELCEYFPGFPAKRELRYEELFRAFSKMTTLTGMSSVVLFELGGSEWAVSVCPERIIEMFRRVTSKRNWRRRLRQKDLKRLENFGTLYESTLISEIWGKEYEKTEKQAMVKLLCECDLLIRLHDTDAPKRGSDALYGLPFLLIKSTNLFSKVKSEYETMVELITKFDKGLPKGLQGGLMAHLSRTVHQGLREVGMVGASSARLVMEKGRIIVEYNATQSEVVWTGFSEQNPLDLVRKCVTRTEQFLNHRAHPFRTCHRTVFRQKCEHCGTPNGLEVDISLLSTASEVMCRKCKVMTSLTSHVRGLANGSSNEIADLNSVPGDLFILPEDLLEDNSARTKAAFDYFGENTLREACKGLSRVIELSDFSDLEEFKTQLQNESSSAYANNYTNCWNENIACFAVSYTQNDAKKGRFKFTDEQWLNLRRILTKLRECGVTRCRVWVDQCLWLRDADQGCWAECGLFPYLLWPVIALGRRVFESDRTAATFERMWPFVEEVLGLWSSGVITSSVERGRRTVDGCRAWVTWKVRQSLRPEQSMRLLLLNIYHGGTKGLKTGWKEDVEELEAMAKWNMESGIEKLIVGPHWRREIACQQVPMSMDRVLDAMVLKNSSNSHGEFLDVTLQCVQKGEWDMVTAWTSGHCKAEDMSESREERALIMRRLIKINVVTDDGVFRLLGFGKRIDGFEDRAIWLLVAMTEYTDDFGSGNVRWTKIVHGPNSFVLQTNRSDEVFEHILREQLSRQSGKMRVLSVRDCSSCNIEWT